MMKFILHALVLILFAPYCYGSDTVILPRFASLKSNEVNVRAGPDTRYPVTFVFVKKGEPVEIIAEFENWRKIRDQENAEGWIHESMLSGKRTVIVKGSKLQTLFKKTNLNSKKIALAEPGIRASLIMCKKKWCKIEANSKEGWIERSSLYGIYAHEFQ